MRQEKCPSIVESNNPEFESDPSIDRTNFCAEAFFCFKNGLEHEISHVLSIDLVGTIDCVGLISASSTWDALCGDADRSGGWWWRSRLKRRSVFGAQHLILGHTSGQFFARQTSGLTFHGP